jgi:hypothetical protein
VEGSGPSEGPRARGPRRVTAAELIVVQSVLAHPTEPGTSRIRRTRIARRTYQWTLQRVRERRWVQERFVPSPGLTGLPFVTVLLATALTGAADRFAMELVRNGRIAHAWRMGERFFAVLFSRAPSEFSEWSASVRSAGLAEEVSGVTADLVDSTLPVYFDFEGEWARYGAISGTEAYPHPLRDRGPRSPAGDPETPGPRLASVAAEMARRAEQASTADEGGGRVGRWIGRFAEEQAVRAGWVEPRGFLDPVAVPRYLSDFAEGITFVSGPLRMGGGPERFAQELIEGSSVHPFLVAGDASSALVGFLSAGPRTRLGPAPPPRASVRATLGRWLSGFEIARYPLAGVETVVRHRYSPLLPAPPGD